jgi:translation initiation factor 6 (eIF-6)
MFFGKQEMAIIIKTNGETEHIEPANSSVFNLKELQKAVGGYIQIVSITTGEYSGRLMIVNEEGLIKPNPQVNKEASRIACQSIVGQVIVIDRDQIV